MAFQRMTARVVGRVQGVGFRWWVRSRGRELGLSGWVANEPDERSVALLVEGDATRLDELERLLWQGPPGAWVEAVEVSREPASGTFEGIEIVRR
jgi:acylphosphatase